MATNTDASTPREVTRTTGPLGLPVRMAVVMFTVPLIAIVLWVALPSSAITVAVTAIAVLLLAGGAVAAAMRPRDLEREPEPKKMDYRS